MTEQPREYRAVTFLGDVYHRVDPLDDTRTLCGQTIRDWILGKRPRMPESVAVEKLGLRLCKLCAKAES